jgi:hypothetical protein
MKKLSALVLIFLAVSQAAAQTNSGSSESKSPRIVRFPPGRSIGTLKVIDAEKKRRIRDYNFQDDGASWYSDYEYLGQAKGDVVVPPGKRLGLEVNWRAAGDLTPLSQLEPDDLYKLRFEWRPSKSPGKKIPTEVDEAWMRNLSRLTGLRELHLTGVKVPRRSMHLIHRLPSLERFWPSRPNDAELAQIAELPRLKALYLTADNCTNRGLRHLRKLTLLEEMQLFMTPGLDRRPHPIVDDNGLVHLKNLSSLWYLALRGNFTDAGLAHLKHIPSLKTLWIAPGTPTDAGLGHIADVATLEALCLWGSDKITNQGLAHLMGLRKLKSLDLRNTPISDDGLIHLREIKTLNRLRLPRAITDRGLALLSEQPEFKHLSVNYSNQITDDGLKHVAGHAALESLKIGGKGITNDGIDYIAELKNLKDLYLYAGGTRDHPQMTDEGLIKLTALKSLSRLTIWNGQFTISAVTRLNDLSLLNQLEVRGIVQDGTALDLSGLTALTDLSLRMGERQSMQDQDLASLAKLQRLRRLTITPPSPKIGNEGIAHLAGLKSLVRLTFGGNLIKDDGLAFLTGLKNLETLDITGTISAEGLYHLEGLKTLRRLEILTRRKINFKAQKKLRGRLPRLEKFDVQTYTMRPVRIPARMRR